MTPQDADQRITRDVFCQRLARVLEPNMEIAAAIDRVAASAPRRSRAELQQAARFFAQDPAPEEVLRHRAALSVCLPLVLSDRSDPPSREQVEASVRAWIYDTRHDHWQTHRRLIALTYPLVVASLTLLIVVLICAFLVPVFEQMFEEFGLSLPTPTLVLVWISHAVRDYSLALLVAGLIAGGVIWAWDRQRQRSGHSPWRRKLSQKFQSDRMALADWASRTASLIQAGLPDHEAVTIAGAVSGKERLQRWAKSGGDQLSRGTDPAEADLSHIGRHGCHVVVHGLRLPGAASQAALLRAAAAIQIDRDQRRSGWWTSALSVLAVFGVGLMVGLVVLALLMPLVSLISGLA